MLSGRPALPGEALGSEGHADIVRRGCEDDECIREVCGPDLTGGGIVGSELNLQAGGAFERSAGSGTRQDERVELGNADGESVLVAQMGELVGEHGLQLRRGEELLHG